MPLPVRADQLEHQHTREAVASRLAAATNHSHLGDFVLGSMDGTVTTFAVVAGAAGAELSLSAAIVLGFANLVADGFSMAAGNFMSARAAQQVTDYARRIEELHIDRIPEGEREEVRQIYANKGFDGALLEEIVTTITNDRRRWVDTMLTEEIGLSLEQRPPWRAAWVTFAAFVSVGLIPLAPYVIMLRSFPQYAFATSAVATGLAFAAIGLARAYVLDQRPWRAALETFSVGATAALLAYVVGKLLHDYAGL